MFKLTCAARGSCLVGPARQLFLADPHDYVTAGFPYVPVACEVWGALPTAGGQPRARLRGWLCPTCWWRRPEVGVSFLSFSSVQQLPPLFLAAPAEPLQDRSWRGPGAPLATCGCCPAAGAGSGAVGPAWGTERCWGSSRHARVNCSSGFGAALVYQGHTMEA